MILALITIQFLWYLPFVRSVGEEAWGARADVMFAQSVARSLPANAIVLTHNPNMFHVWGHSAAQISLAATEPDYVDHVLGPRYAGGVFFHWNFWCNTQDASQVALCQEVLDQYRHRLVAERRERDQRFALYRLLPARRPGAEAASLDLHQGGT
jgi:hypothetical protein